MRVIIKTLVALNLNMHKSLGIRDQEVQKLGSEWDPLLYHYCSQVASLEPLLLKYSLSQILG